MNRSNNYWINRSNERMANYHKHSNDVIVRINRAYDAAIKNINRDMKNIFYKFMNDGNLSESEARELLNSRISKVELNSIRRGINQIKDKELKQYMMAKLNKSAYKARITRLEALKESIDINLKVVADIEHRESTTLYINNINTAYYRSIYDIQKGVGHIFDFATIPKDSIIEILKTKWKGRNYSSSVWKNSEILASKLEDVLLEGLTTGKGYRKMASQLEDLTDLGKFATERLVRTETTYVTNMADIEAYKECGITHYIFVATLDEKTSKECSEMDGVRIAVVNATSGETLPPLHPFCRSTTRGDFENIDTYLNQRIARNPLNNKNMYVWQDMNYNTWKERYVGAEAKVAKYEKSLMDWYENKNK